MVLAWALAVEASGYARAQTPPQQAGEQAAAGKLEESWVRSQLRVFRGYPHLDKTYRLLEAEKTEDARQELETYLSINPGDHEAQVLSLSILYQLKRYGEVIDRADRMLAKQPGAASVLIYRGLSRLALKQFEAGVADLAAVTSGQTGSKEDVVFALGMITDVAIARQDYQTAQQALDRLADQPKDFGYYIRRGLIAAGEQRHGDADTAYRQALAAAAEPKQRLLALREIAENAKKLKDEEAARRAYGMALELSPNDPALMRELANLDYAREDYEGAIGWIRKVIKVKPTFADREFLANLLYQTGNYSAAIEEYNRLLPECPDDAARGRVYLAIGYAHRALHQDREAAEAFRAAARISSDLAVALALSQALEASGDIQAAIDVRSLRSRGRSARVGSRRDWARFMASSATTNGRSPTSMQPCVTRLSRKRSAGRSRRPGAMPLRPRATPIRRSLPSAVPPASNPMCRRCWRSHRRSKTGDRCGRQRKPFRPR